MSKMQNPFGLRSITPYMMVQDAERLIHMLEELFQAQIRGKVQYREDHTVKHAELQVGDSVLMIGGTSHDFSQVEATKAGFYIYVDDCDAVYGKALDMGMEPVMEPTDFPHGDRYGGVRDFAGNTWWVVTHLGIEK